jgi:hypothetical protein
VSWQDYEYGPADDDYMTPDQASDAGWLSPDEYSKGAKDVLDERNRQIHDEGWTTEHDDQYAKGELAQAAVCYARGDAWLWPWSRDWWKPKDERANLVRAAALLIAEIERLDRARDRVVAEPEP